MVHAHESQDGWSSLSSVDSLTDLSVPTPPPSKGSGGVGGAGFRRLNARSVADMARSANGAAFMTDRSHKLPSESDIKAERYRYVPSDREVWRPAIEQLSQKISEQQHELWDLQDKLRDEVRHGDELLRRMKQERKEHKEVVAALTAQLSARHEMESAAQTEAAHLSELELERAWKRCTELDSQRRAAEEDAAARKRDSADLEAKINDLQTQIAGLKLLAAQQPPSANADEQTAAMAELQHDNTALKKENAELKSEVESLRSSAKAHVDNLESLNVSMSVLREENTRTKSDVEALRSSVKTHEASLTLLKEDNARLKSENEALHTSSGDADSLKELVRTLQEENAALKSRDSSLQTKNISLEADMEALTAQYEAKSKERDHEIWQKASHVAAEHIDRVTKQAQTDVSRLNEKVQSQSAIITSQKEFVAMANSQLDYMRSLLGESIGKLLDHRPVHSSHLQPSPLHPSMLHPSPPPQSSPLPSNPQHAAKYSPGPRWPSDNKASGPKDRPEMTPSQAKYQQRTQHKPPASETYTPPRQTGPSADLDVSSSESLSTIQPDSDPGAREWMSKNSAAYPLHQSTMNQSTSMVPSTSTPSTSVRLASPSYGNESVESVNSLAFLDALYERLAKHEISREELEDLENIYDARSEIMAERPKLGMDAKALMDHWRQRNIPRKHAAIVSHMAKDMA